MGDGSAGCVDESDLAGIVEVGQETSESWENKEEQEIDGRDKEVWDKEVQDEKVRDEEVWDEEVDAEWRDEVFSERDSCSPKASTVTCVVFALALVEVNKGGISCVLPLTIMKARAIQKDSVSLRLWLLNPLSARNALSLHT